jgi:hypothetical protein
MPQFAGRTERHASSPIAEFLATRGPLIESVLSQSALAELSKTSPAKRMTMGINERSRQKL